jgi:hypothetical protein
MIKIPIIFGWLVFHREEQLCFCKNPWLVIHWNKAKWMWCDRYSKRLLCIGRRYWTTETPDEHDPWYST